MVANHQSSALTGEMWAAMAIPDPRTMPPPSLSIGAGEPGAGHPHPTPLCTTARPCEGAGAPWEGQAGSTCD